MWNKSGESGPPCLVPEFRGKAFGFSLLSIILAKGLFIYGIYHIETLSSIPILLRVLIIKARQTHNAHTLGTICFGESLLVSTLSYVQLSVLANRESMHDVSDKRKNVPCITCKN